MSTASRSRYLISESALNLSLTPPPSATADSLSCTSSASSYSSSSFAVRRKSFRPTCVPNDQNQPHEARVHNESSSSLVSLGIVLVVSGAQPDSYTRRPLKRPHRAIEREPKEKNSDGQTKEQPRYKPPPPHVPLSIPSRRRQRPLKLTRPLPMYHPLRPLPPLPPPANSEQSTPVESQHPATRSSGRTRRPPPRNLEHLIVAVTNTTKQRQGSPAKKRKVVVIAADEMDVDEESETGSLKKKHKDAGSTSFELADEPMVEETDSSSGRARRAARRSGGKESVTPTPPPQEPPTPSNSKTQAARASSGAQSKKPVSTNGRSNPRRVTRRNSDETSSEEKDTAESTPAPSAPSLPRRTSARRSGGVEHAEGIAVSVRA